MMATVERKRLAEKEIKSDILKKIGWCAAFHFVWFILYSLFVALFFYVITLLWHNYVTESVEIAGVGVALLGVMLAYLLFVLGYHAFKIFAFAARAVTVLISGFRIVQDTLINSDMREYNALKRYTMPTRRRLVCYENEVVMYFCKYGRTVNCMLDSFSEEYGKEFYLAVYGRKNKIAKAYRASEYEIIN